MRRFYLFAALALTALSLSTRAGAQRGGGRGGQAQDPAYPDPPALSFPTPDPIIKRIWVGMDSSRVRSFSQVLFDSLGPRLMGAPNTKAAQDWMVKTYTSFGVTAKNEQYGTWRGWVRGHSHIDLIAPRQRTLEGQMVGYSPGTDGKNVDAEPILMPQFADSNDFVKWLPQAKGKLVMASATRESCRPNSEWLDLLLSAVDRAAGHRQSSIRDLWSWHGLQPRPRRRIAQPAPRPSRRGRTHHVPAQGPDRDDGDLRDVQHGGADDRAVVRRLWPGLSFGAEQSTSKAAHQPRRQAPRRAAGVQHRRNDSGRHQGDEYVSCRRTSTRGTGPQGRPTTERARSRCSRR